MMSDVTTVFFQMVVAIFCLFVMFCVSDFISNPEKYGVIFGKFDSARYEYISDNIVPQD